METSGQHERFGLHAAVKNRHLGPLLRQIEPSEGHLTGSARHWEMNANVIHPAQGPAAGAGERPHPLGGQLGDPLGAMDLAIHHHQNAVAACFAGQGHLHRLEQIEGPVSTEGRCWPHRPHQHHRPGIVDQQLQQPGGFLQRVGAMGDHHPCEIRIHSERLSDTRDQGTPMRKQQIGAVDVGDLLDIDRRQILQLRHRRQQVLTPQHTCAVVVQRRTVGPTAGNGAAGGQQLQPTHGSRRR